MSRSDLYWFSFVETTRKFIIAELSIRKLRSLSLITEFKLVTMWYLYRNRLQLSVAERTQEFQTFDPKLTVTALFASVPNYEENEPLPRYAFDLLV